MGIRVIISGGGTGGHIYPALSIAQALKRSLPDIEILFVGAKGKMEMEKVPAAGFQIKGLPVAGLKRSFSLSNLSLPFKLCKSLSEAGKIIKEFRPDIVVGVGGYASAPVLWKASGMGIPCIIQEQNSYAGLTNKILGKRAEKICVAYENMERFFPKEKILMTGNPIRKGIKPATSAQRDQARRFFALKEELPVVLVVGGSLGCGTLNRTMFALAEKAPQGYQVIWQSGKGYRDSVIRFFESRNPGFNEGEMRTIGNIHNCDFISRMDLAFAAADIVVSRAGAGTISELCAAGKATIFVPSPVVAEDHQRHNAMALVNQDAAIMIEDDKAAQELIPAMERLVSDTSRIRMMEENILKLAKPDASDVIASVITETLSLERNV